MAPGLKTPSGIPPLSGKRQLSDFAKPKVPTPSNPSSLKKTRDLPNLTECQACGCRTDTANGKNRIQTLYSEWRIVLLCPRCHHRVESSQICSYCLKEVSDDCYSCGQCKRSLHKTCFLNYKSVPPWSYSIRGSEFTVCIDCWVPKQIARKRGISRRKRKAKNSRVLGGREGGEAEVLEDVVKQANSAMEKKVEAAVKARETAAKKAVVAKRAVEKASDALEECDDAELAFRLLRAMNSSPRILKSRILGDRKGLEPLIAGNRALSCLKPTQIVYARRRKKPIEIVYTRRRNKPNVMVYVRRGKKPTKLVYKRRGKHIGCNEMCGVDIEMKEMEESCSIFLSNSSGFDSSMKSESEPCCNQDGSAACKDMQSDGKLVEYMLKYSRKKTNEISKGKTEFLSEGYNLQSQSTSSQLPEPLKISASSFQCCDIPHPALDGANDSCQVHS